MRDGICHGVLNPLGSSLATARERYESTKISAHNLESEECVQSKQLTWGILEALRELQSANNGGARRWDVAPGIHERHTQARLQFQLEPRAAADRVEASHRAISPGDALGQQR